MNANELKQAAADRAEEVARWLYPNGSRSGHEWLVSSLEGGDGDSLGINIRGKAGVWKDFASGEKGGSNFVDLIMKKDGIKFPEACRKLADFFGVSFDSDLHRPNGRSSHSSTGPARNGNTSKPSPAPAKPKEDGTKFPEYAWDKETFWSPELVESLATERKLSPAFLEWMRAGRLIGFVEVNGQGPRVAFPVHDSAGRIIAAHVKQQMWNPRKQERVWKWKYQYAVPEGISEEDYSGPGTQPLVLGDPSTARECWVFESQWDAAMVMDILRFHEMPGWEQMPCILITRTASKGDFVERLARPGLIFRLFAQNDLPNPKTGNIPSEEWVAACVKAAGECPVSRVVTPAQYEDVDAWVKDGGATGTLLLDAVELARPARKSGLPQLINASAWAEAKGLPPQPPQVLHGMLYQGGKLLVGGPSKARKSWNLNNLAISVAAGQPWLNIPTTKGRVLVFDFELQQHSLARRLHWIAQKRGLTAALRNVEVLSMRGFCDSLDDLSGKLLDLLLDTGPYLLAIFDPAYKLQSSRGQGPQRKENAAEDVGAMFNELERLAVHAKVAVAIGAHFAKGNAAAKESIDRVSGSGVYARDPDAILTMTPHTEEDCFTIEPTLRDFPPMSKFAIRWDYPLFERAPDLDPDDLKQPAERGIRRTDPDKAVRANDCLNSAKDRLGPLFVEKPSWRLAELQSQLATGGKGTPSQSVVEKWFYGLRDNGCIAPSPTVRGIHEITPKWAAELAAEHPPETEPEA